MCLCGHSKELCDQVKSKSKKDFLWLSFVLGSFSNQLKITGSKGVTRKKIIKDDLETGIEFIIQEQKMTFGEATRYFNLKKNKGNFTFKEVGIGKEET